MRRAVLISLCLAALATSASAQIIASSHYDLYYVLPGEAGSKGADVGISAADISSIGDVGVVNALGKYSINEKIEVGARAELGLLNDNLETLSTVTVGAKYSLRETCAASAALLVPTGDADDPGLSLGFMHTHQMGDAMINNWLQVGLLDGYTAYTSGTGVNLHLLVEPTMAFGDQVTGYFDVFVHSNTDDIAGDWLGIDLGPNVDYMINDKCVVNAGVTLGAVGDAKQDDLGLIVTLVSRF